MKKRLKRIEAKIDFLLELQGASQEAVNDAVSLRTGGELEEEDDEEGDA